MGIKTWLAKEEAATSEDAFLEPFVRVSLWSLAGIVTAATITGLVESFDGLYNWFSTHGVTGWKADYAPLMVDSFSVIGELALFVAISRRWAGSRRILPWISALIGMSASIAGNVGDKAGHPVTWMLTAAIAPLAGAFGIIVGLGVLKQVGKDVVARAKARKAEVTVSQDDIIASLVADRDSLRKELEAAKSVSVLNISPEGLEELQNDQYEVPVPHLEAPNRDRELKGMDVLIPPRPLAEPDDAPLGSFVQPQTQPQPAVPSVSRSEARSRLTDLRPGRQLITQTDSFPAVA